MLIIEKNNFLLPLRIPYNELIIGFYNPVTKTLLSSKETEEFEKVKKGLNKGIDSEYHIMKFFNSYYVYKTFKVGTNLYRIKGGNELIKIF